MSRPSTLALINPMADYGIDTYTYELAQGLAANGVQVDVYCADASILGTPPLHANHRRYAVLGSRLWRNATAVRSSLENSPASHRNGNGPKGNAATVSPWRRSVRRLYLPTELGLRLKRHNYDAVWTQWAELADYEGFWRASRFLRIPIVHTVHNILPHERRVGDVAAYRKVYETARLLFVHSSQVRDEFSSLFPEQASKTVVVPHGSYTLYRRQPEARSAVRSALRIPADAVVLLFCGAIREYKNIDAAIGALAQLKRDDVVLIIAGSEPGDGADPLARTRATIQRAGVEHRVRLVSGFLDQKQMAEIFEASDILLLPYSKSYGSGLLMLGMTFGKYVVATKPGMEESASIYTRSVLLQGADTASVLAGIETAIERMRTEHKPFAGVPCEFDWVNIAATSLEQIGRALAST
jgi:glycosyltransferase involved in cell wall biosynthesis